MAIKTILLSILAASTAHAAGEAQAYASTGDGTVRFREIEPPILAKVNTYELETWELKMSDLTGLKQAVRGFGATVTEATVDSFAKLNGTARENLLRELLTPDGINLRYMRIANGTYDDFGKMVTGNEQVPDSAARNFELGERGEAAAQLLAEMKRIQPELQIVASPRAPPRWMRMEVSPDNPNRNNTYAHAYGEYLADYVDEFAAAGVPIDAMTIKAEPIHDQKKAKQTKGYLSAEQFGSLITTFVAPALKAAGHGTKIWAYDSNTVDYQYAKTLVNATKDVIKGIAWNCYSGDGPAKWKPLLKMDEYSHGLPEQYMTECWTDKGKTSWKHTLDYIILPLAKRISGVMVGALATYPHGGPVPPGDDECFTCTGVITVEPTNGTYTKEVDYYMLGMFSKYIPTRDARIAKMRHSKLYADGTGIRAIATVNFGEGGETRTVVIQSRFKKDVWVSLIAEGDKKSWNGRVLANGVTTWILPPAGKKRPRWTA